MARSPRAGHIAFRHIFFMGKARDELLRRLGEKPCSQERYTDAELMSIRYARYAAQKRLPPEIERLRREHAAGSPAESIRTDPSTAAAGPSRKASVPRHR